MIFTIFFISSPVAKIQSALSPHGMPSVSPHLPITGSLCELVVNFEASVGLLPLCAQPGLGNPFPYKKTVTPEPGSA